MAALLAETLHGLEQQGRHRQRQQQQGRAAGPEAAEGRETDRQRQGGEAIADPAQQPRLQTLAVQLGQPPIGTLDLGLQLTEHHGPHLVEGLGEAFGDLGWSAGQTGEGEPHLRLGSGGPDLFGHLLHLAKGAELTGVARTEQQQAVTDLQRNEQQETEGGQETGPAHPDQLARQRPPGGAMQPAGQQQQHRPQQREQPRGAQTIGELQLPGGLQQGHRPDELEQESQEQAEQAIADVLENEGQLLAVLRVGKRIAQGRRNARDIKGSQR